jgi:hypothetical protein
VATRRSTAQNSPNGLVIQYHNPFSSSQDRCSA